jgi:hypothetical protein
MAAGVVRMSACFVAKSMQLDRRLAIGLLYADGFQAVA